MNIEEIKGKADQLKGKAEELQGKAQELLNNPDVQEKINQLEEEKAKILSETQESSDKKETQTEEDDGTAGLVGTWGSDSLHWSAPSLMVLHQDGTCMLDGLSSYTWSVKSGVITFEDSVGVGYKKEHNYEIHGDILTLEDEENGKCIYNRK